METLAQLLNRLALEHLERMAVNRENQVKSSAEKQNKAA